MLSGAQHPWCIQDKILRSAQNDMIEFSRSPPLLFMIHLLLSAFIGGFNLNP